MNVMSLSYTGCTEHSNVILIPKVTFRRGNKRRAFVDSYCAVAVVPTLAFLVCIFQNTLLKVIFNVSLYYYRHKLIIGRPNVQSQLRWYSTSCHVYFEDTVPGIRTVLQDYSTCKFESEIFQFAIYLL
jgi:hypothetical protein